MIGTSFNDTITGDSADNRLEGRGGDDIISGGAGNDMLLGGEGNDIIDGGDGNDTLIAGQGNDTLKGGNGNDTYSFDQDWEQAVIIETADDGVDTLDFSALSWDLYFTLRPEAGSVSSGLSSASWRELPLKLCLAVRAMIPRLGKRRLPAGDYKWRRWQEYFGL